MSYRCISAFEFAGVIYPGGLLVDDDNTIIATHAAFFARVDESHTATQTATAAPGEKRDVPHVAPHAAAKKTAARKPATHATKSEHNPEEGT